MMENTDFKIPESPKEKWERPEIHSLSIGKTLAGSDGVDDGNFGAS